MEFWSFRYLRLVGNFSVFTATSILPRVTSDCGMTSSSAIVSFEPTDYQGDDMSQHLITTCDWAVSPIVASR